MKLYAIHAPRAGGPEEARAAPTGFAFGALVFGPLWLLARGLWLALASYVALAVVVGVAYQQGFLRGGAVALLVLLGHLYLAVEGRAMRMRRRPLVDVVFARSRLEAEKVYLERALASGAIPLRSPPPPGSGDVIGLFPEPTR